MIQGSHHALGAAVRATAHLLPQGQEEAWALQGGIAEWAFEGTSLHLQKQFGHRALGRQSLISM